MACALPPLAVGGFSAASTAERPPRLPTRTVSASVAHDSRGVSATAVLRSGSRSRASSCSAAPRASRQASGYRDARVIDVADSTPRQRRAASSRHTAPPSLERPRHTAPASLTTQGSGEVRQRRAASPRDAAKPVVTSGQAARPSRISRSASTNQADAAGYNGSRAARDTMQRYVVQFGNNSGLIRQILRARTLWGPAPGDPGSALGKGSYQDKSIKLNQPCTETEINLLWSQYKCKAFFDAMAAGRSGVAVVLNEEKTIKLKTVKSASSSASIVRCHNHFEGSGQLCTKRGICESMSSFYLRLGRDPFGVVPLTFIIREGTADPQFALWRSAFDAFDEEAGHRIWIVKPGEWGNRGCGIKIYNDADQVTQRIDSKEKVWAIQKYIEKPLLIHKRKFDIRAYCLVLQEPNGGPLRAYCYRDAYLRTTSVKYTTKRLDKMAHLNNDAVQKNGENYGKFESANKMSLDEFQKYLDEHHARDGLNVRQQIMGQMAQIMADTVRAAAPKLNPRGIANCFEVYGFDFMMDASYRLWLIECNANPCLDLCCSYLSRIIPAMLDEAFQLTVDRIFNAPAQKADTDHGGEGGTKWDSILDSSKEAWPSDVISCSWVESLPKDLDASEITRILGRQIICGKRAKGKKKTFADVSQQDSDIVKSPAKGNDDDDEESDREAGMQQQAGIVGSTATTDCAEEDDDDEEEEFQENECDEDGEDDELE